MFKMNFSKITIVLILAFAATWAPAQDAPTINPRVKFQTSLGDFVVQLNGDKAPISTLNFLKYVENGFYDGTIFHRVISTFMLQAGGFSADGSRKTAGLMPPIKNEWKNGLKNKRGTLSMARTSNPNSATSQFFVNVVDNAFLDQPRGGAAYAVFGKIVEGMDVVDKIKNVEVKVDRRFGSEKASPVEMVVIEKATLLDKPDIEKIKENAGSAKSGIEKKSKSEAEQRREADKKALKDFIKSIEGETGKKVQRRPSGLIYITLEEGTGPTPKPTDKVEVHYKAMLLSGKTFHNTIGRGQPERFPLSDAVKGFAEGLSLTKMGGKTLIIVPSDLGYGAKGRGADVPPDSMIVYEAQLLNIMSQ